MKNADVLHPRAILKRIVGHSMRTFNFLKMLLLGLELLLKLLPSFYSLSKQTHEFLNFRIKRVSSLPSTSALDYDIYQLLTYLSWQDTTRTQ